MMKGCIFLLCFLFALQSFAQEPEQLKDSLPGRSEMKIIHPRRSAPIERSKIRIIRKNSGHPQNSATSELLILGDKPHKRIPLNRRFSKFKGHWSGFNYGFVNFAKTDYSMYDPQLKGFMDLDWAHSFAMQFNLYNCSINLVPRNNFGLITGIGLEYQRLRFENDQQSVHMIDHKLYPFNLKDQNITNVKRSSFKTLYITVPLLLEVQFPAKYRQRLYLSGGIMGGLRVHSKTKVVYDDEDGDKHKWKKSNNYNMVPFKADVVAKIGYKWLNVWGSYTLTKMFKSGKGPELHAYTIGFGVTY